MTDPRRGTAHWGAAAVVAPAAAAALALATGWALQHDPTASQHAAAASPARSPQSHPVRADLDLNARALGERDRVVALQRTLARVRAKVESVRTAPVPSWRSFTGGGSGGSTYVGGSSGSSRSSGGGTVRVAAPPRVSAPRPATHTSTGAS